MTFVQEDRIFKTSGKKTPGEPGHTHETHTGHAGAQGHTDNTDEPHNHPNPPTHNPHDSATAETVADSTAAAPEPTAIPAADSEEAAPEPDPAATRSQSASPRLLEGGRRNEGTRGRRVAAGVDYGIHLPPNASNPTIRVGWWEDVRGGIFRCV